LAAKDALGRLVLALSAAQLHMGLPGGSQFWAVSACYRGMDWTWRGGCFKRWWRISPLEF